MKAKLGVKSIDLEEVAAIIPETDRLILLLKSGREIELRQGDFKEFLLSEVQETVENIFSTEINLN